MRVRKRPVARPMLTDDVLSGFRWLRIANAIAELCVEQGYTATTVAHIAKRAKCSRGAIYEFGNKDEIFVAFLGQVVAGLFDRVDESCAAGDGDPAVRKEAALRTVLEWVAVEPASAWALLVDAPSGPAEAFALHLDALAGFAERLDRSQAGEGATGRSVAELIVGGIASILRQTLIAGDAKHAPALLPELLTFLRQASPERAPKPTGARASRLPRDHPARENLPSPLPGALAAMPTGIAGRRKMAAAGSTGGNPALSSPRL
jgi:AcrR family transcriptional regulator